MERTPTPHEALLTAIEVAGSQSALSRQCGMSQPVISLWLKAGKGCSPEHVLAIEAATNVPRHDLRPDIYPADLGPSPAWMPVFQGVDAAARRVACEPITILHGSAAA